MLSSGMMLKQRYEILDDIGAGGMARVYKIMDHVLHRPAAMKVLKDELQHDEAYLRKFHREAQAAAGLTHDHIVNVYDVDHDQGYWFIVMELVEGLTLKQYIKKRGRLRNNECLSIALQAADGLAAAHRAGIVHRDIKPENLILTLEGNVKISDFGIARVQSGETMTVDVCGSVSYSSPEQVRGGYSDQRTDIYSLGVTMYEMCTGTLPYSGHSVVEVAMQHMDGKLTMPREIFPEIPERFNQIIGKCMSKRMDDRYQHMDELMRDLMLCMKNPDSSIQTSSPRDAMQGETMIFSKEQMDTIKKGAEMERRKKVKQLKEKVKGKASAVSAGKKFKKSKKEQASKKQSGKKQARDEEYEVYEEDDYDEISSGLKKALNIGLIVVIIVVLLCVIEFIMSSMGMFKGITSHMPSLDKMTEFFDQIREKLGSAEMRQSVGRGLNKLLKALSGGS